MEFSATERETPYFVRDSSVICFVPIPTRLLDSIMMAKRQHSYCILCGVLRVNFSTLFEQQIGVRRKKKALNWIKTLYFFVVAKSSGSCDVNKKPISTVLVAQDLTLDSQQSPQEIFLEAETAAGKPTRILFYLLPEQSKCQLSRVCLSPDLSYKSPLIHFCDGAIM